MCRNILGPKNHRRKIDKIHENFELYQVFIIFCSKLCQYSQYIYYLQKDSIHFGIEASKQFRPKIFQKKNQQNSQRYLNYTKSSIAPKCFDTYKSYILSTSSKRY